MDLHRAAVWMWVTLAIVAFVVCVAGIVAPAPCCGDGSITAFGGAVGILLWAVPTLLVLIWLDGDSPRASIVAGVVGVGYSVLCILLLLSAITAAGQGSPRFLVLVLAVGIAYMFAGLAAVFSRPAASGRGASDDHG